MTEKENIRKAVEMLKNDLIKSPNKSDIDLGRISAFEDVLLYIDSLEEKSLSESLEDYIEIVSKSLASRTLKGKARKAMDTVIAELINTGAYLTKEEMISKTCEWLKGLNDSHEIMSYTDSHTVETDELIQYFKNFIESRV